MGRLKNKIISKRISLTGQVSPIKYDDVLKWLEALPNKKRFPTVMNVLNIVVGVLENETGDDAGAIKGQ